jgi:hypothetical protein
MSPMRYVLLLVALLFSAAPAVAQRGTNNSTVSVTVSRAVTSSHAGTTDWRWMTSGIRAGEALWRNFWRGAHAGAARRDACGRGVRANAFQRGQAGREVRGGTPDILTGANQRIDILTGRPID